MPALSNLAELKNLIASDLTTLNPAQADELSWIVEETKEFLHELEDSTATTEPSSETRQAYANSLLCQGWHSRITTEKLENDHVCIDDGHRAWTARRADAFLAWNTCVSYSEFCTTVAALAPR